ncbi:hypothetical protein CBR_g31857 [Chara braunii]|uniref:CCHC-type domain-containing protein n=1 Tax=Chara braunii TaxID=69332 RepID=A0A388LG70_CHABU|nr:hypothetical protein CBR_g31857 [Chara braunii]|eukprot:GBG81182.1 hypothetical protein CBR_g31857 [Chara braunii]
MATTEEGSGRGGSGGGGGGEPPRRGPPICYGCGKPGHFKFECWKYSKVDEGRQGSPIRKWEKGALSSTSNGGGEELGAVGNLVKLLLAKEEAKEVKRQEKASRKKAKEEEKQRERLKQEEEERKRQEQIENEPGLPRIVQQQLAQWGPPPNVERHEGRRRRRGTRRIPYHPDGWGLWEDDVEDLRQKAAGITISIEKTEKGNNG